PERLELVDRPLPELCVPAEPKPARLGEPPLVRHEMGARDDLWRGSPEHAHGTMTSAPSTSPARSFASAPFASSTGNASTLERARLDGRAHRPARGEREQLLAVLSRQICDRPENALAPEDRVRKRRDVAHVDAGVDDRAALRDCAKCRGDELAGRGEDDRGI